MDFIRVTLYQFYDNSDAPMDAHFEVQEGDLILHSRGGAIGTANAQNTEYGPALRILLRANFSIEHDTGWSMGR